MADWGIVDHGLDSYEEFINFDEMIFIRAVYRSREGNEMWLLKIKFKNGMEEETNLSQKGYEWFCRKLKIDGEKKEGLG